MAELPPDFRVCPHCGARDLEVRSRERLAGANRPTLTVSVDGPLDGAEWGLTEPYWETSTTTAYVADCCDEELPEAYQEVLDLALANERLPG